VSDIPHQPEALLPELTSEAKSWAVLCHLSALSGLLTGGLGFLVGPLVIWLVKRNDHPFIDDQGKEALNFQISLFIYILLLSCTIIGIPIALALIVADVVLTIVAAVKASNGMVYRYPLTIRLIS